MVLNLQCQHHNRFDQSLLEYQEIRAHIQESTFSVHHVEFDPDVKVSCQDPLKFQNSVSDRLSAINYDNKTTEKILLPVLTLLCHFKFLLLLAMSQRSLLL